MASIPDLGWGDADRTWWRVAVVLLVAVAWVVGSTSATPPLDFETAHLDYPRYVGVLAGLLAAYLVIAIWPVKPGWSPEIVTFVGVVAVTVLYWSGLITYEYSGHIHRIEGNAGFALAALALVLATYVRPPKWLARLPRPLVVGVVGVGIALGALAEHQYMDAQRENSAAAQREARNIVF